MWSEEKEKKWKELTELREANKKEVGKIHTIEVLQKMIDSLKSGKEMPGEISIEYLRSPEIFGYEGSGPVIGKKITLTYY